MESHSLIAEFSVESDTWNTLWLIQKALRDGRKTKIPVKIEIRSGSIESTISLIADVFAMGSFLLSVVTYIYSRREQDKPIRITKINRDAAYAYSIKHLRESADVPKAKIISERPTSNGYFFEFEDNEGGKHQYVITNDFDVKYSHTRKHTQDHA